MAKQFVAVRMDAWREVLASLSRRTGVSPQQAKYACLFFVQSDGWTDDDAQMISDICANFTGRPDPEWDDLVTLLVEETTTENARARVPKMMLVEIPTPRFLVRLVAILSRKIDFATSELWVVPAYCVINCAGTSLLTEALSLANPVLKRASQVMMARRTFRSTPSVCWVGLHLWQSQTSVIFQEIVQQRGNRQVLLLKFTRYLTYLMTSVLSQWMALIETSRHLIWMCSAVSDPAAAREFSRFVTEVIREVLASPTLTPPEMVKRRIDAWVTVYSMVLQNPVAFTSIEKHMQFAMALAGYSKVRYPTGSFWFAILNRLVDWDRPDILKSYFETIMDNDVRLFDKGDLVTFIKGLRNDNTLDAKLQVLAVITARLKGSRMLHYVSIETFDTLEPFLGQEGLDKQGLLLDMFLEAMGDE
jgi:hypothetical protein